MNVLITTLILKTIDMCAHKKYFTFRDQLVCFNVIYHFEKAVWKENSRYRHIIICAVDIIILAGLFQGNLTWHSELFRPLCMFNFRYIFFLVIYNKTWISKSCVEFKSVSICFFIPKHLARIHSLSMKYKALSSLALTLLVLVLTIIN